MYDTQAEADQKLSNTVVMFDDDPVFITSVSMLKKCVQLNIVKLKNWSMRNTSVETFDISDDRFDFRNLGGRLGNINYENKFKESVFSYRIGIRKAHQTQGLSECNIRFITSGKQQLSFNRMFDAAPLLDTFHNKYPSLKQVQAMLSGKYIDDNLLSIAFNKKFSIRVDPVGPFYLQYKARDIGYSTDFCTFTVAHEFRHLYEVIEGFDDLKVA